MVKGNIKVAYATSSVHLSKTVLRNIRENFIQAKLSLETKVKRNIFLEPKVFRYLCRVVAKCKLTKVHANVKTIY